LPTSSELFLRSPTPTTTTSTARAPGRSAGRRSLSQAAFQAPTSSSGTCRTPGATPNLRADFRPAPHHPADALGDQGQQVAPTIDTHAWYCSVSRQLSRDRSTSRDLQFSPAGPTTTSRASGPSPKTTSLLDSPSPIRPMARPRSAPAPAFITTTTAKRWSTPSIRMVRSESAPRSPTLPGLRIEGDANHSPSPRFLGETPCLPSTTADLPQHPGLPVHRAGGQLRHHLGPRQQAQDALLESPSTLSVQRELPGGFTLEPPMLAAWAAT
jgi:hypothetical protein